MINIFFNLAHISHTNVKEKRKHVSQDESIVFCHNIIVLLLYLGAVSYDPHDWCLLLDSSKRSLKCVLNRNGIEYSSLPLGHSAYAKETYKNIKRLLSWIKYDNHKWVIWVDLKMVSFLLGEQGGYTK